MADPVEVQRYDKDGFAESDGCYYMHADVAPLLAELATVRERTRRRDAATEPPPEGEWVLGLAYRYSRFHPSRRGVVRWAKGYYLDETGVVRHVTRWWPLPQTGEP